MDINIINFIKNAFTDYTLRTVISGSAILGIISGSLGSYSFLRKQSLIGDAISHAALPGIALAFIFTKSRAPVALIIGAFIAGWLGMLFVMSIVKTTKIKDDGALGIILSVFFGLGLVLLTFIQRMPYATQAGLDKYLFGQAATLMEHDIIVMLALGLTAIFIMILFWKELKILSFDPDFACCIGLPVKSFDILITTMTVIAIVIGLQTVGVVLMSAMLVAPAAAARQWTNNLGFMVILSGVFGALSGIAGAVASGLITHLPTGPAIVVAVTFIVLVSMLFAPNRGIVWNFIRHQKNQRLIETETVLLSLYSLSLQHNNNFRSYSISMIKAMLSDKIGVKRTLKELEKKAFVRLFGSKEWAFTDKGFIYAKSIADKFKND